jgi:hypothetical protein
MRSPKKDNNLPLQNLQELSCLSSSPLNFNRYLLRLHLVSFTCLLQYLIRLYFICIREVSLFKSCLAPLNFTCFFLKVEDLCQGEYFFVSKKGRNYLSKREHSFRGSNLLRAIFLLPTCFKCLPFRWLMPKGEKFRDQSNENYIKHQTSPI